MHGEVRVRRVTAQDWEALRDLRLEALADTPIGFLEVLRDAEQMADEEWRARAVRGSAGGTSHQVLAWDGPRAVGTCAVLPEDGRDRLARVYVTPSHRGHGVLRAMLHAFGPVALALEVHEDNVRAQAVYARLGFVPTGERQAYAPDPTRQELVMVRPGPDGESSGA